MAYHGDNACFMKKIAEQRKKFLEQVDVVTAYLFLLDHAAFNFMGFFEKSCEVAFFNSCHCIFEPL